MDNKPVIGKYFLVTAKANNLFLIGKIIKLHDENDEDWEVKILKTNIRDYKNDIGSNVVCFIYKNDRINVEYFEYKYELLAKVI